MIKSRAVVGSFDLKSCEPHDRKTFVSYTSVAFDYQREAAFQVVAGAHVNLQTRRI